MRCCSGAAQAATPCLLKNTLSRSSDTEWTGNAGSMLDWNQCPTVERVPGKVSGAWLFRGTRVPVKALFENLEDGASVDDFVLWFPGVKRQQVFAVLAFRS
jgi:uncharacterized protein (DUF433 family)